MATNNEQLKALASRYKAGLCTDEEIIKIRKWYDDAETNGFPIPNEEEIERASFLAAVAAISMVQNMQNGTSVHVANGSGKARSGKIFSLIRYGAAALVVLSLGIGIAHYFQTDYKGVADRPIAVEHSAGGAKAYLVLASGQRMSLNELQQGQIASQETSNINKTSSGVIQYEEIALKSNRRNTPSALNTVFTPRGGEFKIILSDGTKVWLNSSSSIRFPVAFTGRDRTVETTGEVYFEVAKSKSRSFKVLTGEQTITVLGTHFNVQAYSDEAQIKSTLIEGSVKVSKGMMVEILKPGQQAIVGERIEVCSAEVSDAVAWKDGKTVFINEDLRSIMRKVSRWYDLDIEYQGKPSGRTFTGAISRQSNLSALLRILRLNDIKFSMRGKTLIVTE